MSLLLVATTPELVDAAMVAISSIGFVVRRKWLSKIDSTNEPSSRLENEGGAALNAPKVSKNTNEGLSWDVGAAAVTMLPHEEMTDRTYDSLCDTVKVKGKNPLYLGSEPSLSGGASDLVLDRYQESASNDNAASSVSSYQFGVIKHDTEGKRTTSLGNLDQLVSPTPLSSETTSKESPKQADRKGHDDMSANVRSTPDVGYIGVAGIDHCVPTESDQDFSISEVDESQEPSLIASKNGTQEPHSITFKPDKPECDATAVHQLVSNAGEQPFLPPGDTGWTSRSPPQSVPAKLEIATTANDCTVMGIHRQREISPGKKFKRSPVKEMVNDCHIMGMPRMQPILPTSLDSETADNSDGCGTPPPSESDGPRCSPFIFPAEMSGEAASSDGASQPSSYQNSAFQGAFGRRAWTGAADSEDAESTHADEIAAAGTESTTDAEDVQLVTGDAGTPVATKAPSAPDPIYGDSAAVRASLVDPIYDHANGDAAGFPDSLGDTGSCSSAQSSPSTQERVVSAPDPIYGDSAAVRASLVDPIYDRVNNVAAGFPDSLEDTGSCSSAQSSPSTQERVVWEVDSPSEASAPSLPPLSEILEEPLNFASTELGEQNPTYDNCEYAAAEAREMLSRARLSRVLSGPAEEDFRSEHAGDFVDNLVDDFSAPPGNLPSLPGDIPILSDQPPSKLGKSRSLYSDMEFQAADNGEYVDTFLKSIMPAMVGLSAVVAELKGRNRPTPTVVTAAGLPEGWTAAVDLLSEGSEATDDVTNALAKQARLAAEKLEMGPR